jgi:hypothetical protein
MFLDKNLPKQVRRRILEASVRASSDWHDAAIKQAYSSGDDEWKLTAVFAMRFVRGFDAQIMESLQNPDEEIHAEAVMAAGEAEIKPAWKHVRALINDPKTPKHLLLAAIGAVPGTQPGKAREVLLDLAGSGDEEIADAAQEALGMAFDPESEDPLFS